MSVGFYSVLTNRECCICMEHDHTDMRVHGGINGRKHPFCQKCISLWLQAHSTCPVCKVLVDRNSVIPLKDRLIQEIKLGVNGALIGIATLMFITTWRVNWTGVQDVVNVPAFATAVPAAASLLFTLNYNAKFIFSGFLLASVIGVAKTGSGVITDVLGATEVAEAVLGGVIGRFIARKLT